LVVRFVAGPALAVVLAGVPVSSFAGTSTMIAAGPDVGLWDVADGHHAVGLHLRAMVHLGAQSRKSFRLDGTYSTFWAEGEQNRDYAEYAGWGNFVLGFTESAAAYWTIGAGIDGSNESDASLIFGTGFGTRQKWGNIEARFELASTSGGIGAHVPVFFALRF
jgi:hypothetical protein